MADYIGPGFGFLIGTKMAESRNASDAQGEEIERMRQEMQAKMRTALERQAFGEAAAEVTAEIVQELAAEAADQKGLRRLSSPQNIDGRNEAYGKKAEANIRRLSGGKVRTTRTFVEEVKRDRPLK